MSLIAQRATSRARFALPSRALRYLPATAALFDAAAILLTSSLAAVGRHRLGIFDGSADVSDQISVAAPLIVALWLAVVAVHRGYAATLFDAGTEEFRRVTGAGVVTAGLVGAGCYLLKYPLSRGYFFLLFALGIPAVALGRLLLRNAVRSARQRGALFHTVVIAGHVHSVDEVAAVLTRDASLGYRVVGAVVTGTELDAETPGGVPVLGGCGAAIAAVKSVGADVIFFADGGVESAERMREMAWDLEHDDIQVIVAPSISGVSSERVRIRPVGGLPLIHVDPPRATEASRWGKRLFDITGALGLLLMTSPLFLLAAVRIRFHDGGPILFRQTRIGRDGEAFSCLKFRTMVTDAETLLAQLHAQSGYSEGLFKLKDDPRITRPGRWLRRYSIDELPQLLNVLGGAMSLIGPRPPLPLEVEQYVGSTSRRLRVRPGLTGLWQVSGRSDLSFDEAIRLDIYYVDNWSMLQDLSILTKTIGAVLGKNGAY